MLDKKTMAGGKKTQSGMAKSPRQSETSMSSKYKGTPKVSFSTIDNIKKMGMTAALKKAGTSSNKEYIEGVRRMYGEKRLAAARGMKSASPMMPGPGPASRMSARGAERGTPAKKSAPSSPRPTPAQEAQGKARAGGNAPVTTTKTGTTKPRAPYVAPKPTAAQVEQGKARAGVPPVRPKSKPRPKVTPATAAARAAAVKKAHQQASNRSR